MNRAPRTRQQGFTLIEIMIVLAIITAILAIGAPRLFNSGATMRSSIRKLAVLTREIRNNSRLYNVTTRLAIKLEGEKGSSYNVESTTGNVTLTSEEDEKELERLTTMQREGEEKKSKFDAEKRVLKSEVSLPRGLFISSVEYGSRKDPVTEGMAYIHFFPQGLSEDTAIHLTDGKTLNWTIAINPLTGRAQVYERDISLKQLRAN